MLSTKSVSDCASACLCILRPRDPDRDTHITGEQVKTQLAHTKFTKSVKMEQDPRSACKTGVLSNV